MKDLKRNLIYWCTTYEKLTLGIMLGVSVYMLMKHIVGDGADVKTELLGYLCFLICLTSYILGFTALTTYFPLTISLGSSRKASFTAMQIAQHLCAIQYVLFGGILYYFLDQEILRELIKYLPAILGVVMLLMALANLTCVVSLRFGKVAGIIFYILSLLLMIVIFVVVLVSMDLENSGKLAEIREFIQKPQLFFVGIIADIISNICYYPIIKKADLQF